MSSRTRRVQRQAAANEAAPKKEIPTLITSWDDLAPEIFNVEIEHKGKLRVLQMRELTYWQWFEAGSDIPDAEPPPRGVDPQGRPVLNFNDPTYLQQARDVGLERGYRRVLASIVMPVPGETKDEQVKFLKNLLTTKVMNALVGFVEKVAMGGSARILARSESFLTDGSVDPEDLSPVGINAAGIHEAAGVGTDRPAGVHEAAE